MAKEQNVSAIRQVPAAIEAEQALLGAIIRKPDCFDLIGGMVTAEDFYLAEHQHIFAAIDGMYTKSKQIDPITLANALLEYGDRDEVGGLQYIATLAENVPTTANVKDYAAIVKDKSTLRHLIDACDEINKDAYEESDPVRTIVDAAEQRIFNITHEVGTKDLRHVRDVLQVVYKNLEVLSENHGPTAGVKTGFSGLDHLLVEMGKADLIIVGARPGMGKTSFALNVATNVAKASKKAVAIFSLEMSAEQLVTRVLSSEAMVDSNHLRTGILTPEEWDNIAMVTEELSGCDIYIDDTTEIGTTEIKSKLRRIQNLGLVVIDYLGLMKVNTKIDSRAQQVGELSRNLKIMAKDLGIPILCCAQLNRGTEGRGNESKRPTLSDLRDSGSIEQDADVVLFLYRDSYYSDIAGKDDEESAKNANIAEIIVAKNRHGAVDNIKMGWVSQFSKFRTLDTTQGP